MADVVSTAKRSEMMAGIRSKDTKPEMLIRRGLHERGYRFRLHRKDLPGKPDIVLPKYGAAIFVNGCFWHGHDCHLFKWPKTREAFWRVKICGNVARDRAKTQALKVDGWKVGVLWECAVRKEGAGVCIDALTLFLEHGKKDEVHWPHGARVACSSAN